STGVSCRGVRRTWIMSTPWGVPPPRRRQRVRRAARPSGAPPPPAALALVISVAVVVVTAPDSLPAPRRRLPTPARAPIETNAEWHRGEGEAAMAEAMDASECNPIDAWCN